MLFFLQKKRTLLQSTLVKSPPRVPSQGDFPLRLSLSSRHILKTRSDSKAEPERGERKIESQSEAYLMASGMERTFQEDTQGSLLVGRFGKVHCSP